MLVGVSTVELGGVWICALWPGANKLGEGDICTLGPRVHKLV